MAGRRRVGMVVAAAMALLGVLVAGLALAGRTGPDGTEAGSSGAGSAPAAPSAAVVPSGAGERRGSAPAPPDVPDAADAADAAAGQARPAPGGAAVPVPTVPGVTGREIVRSAQLTVEVAEPAAAARGVRNAVTAAGGFVAEEQVEKDAAWLVVRVPVTRLDGVVDDLAATGTVTARSARAEDATDQVVDLDSRVATQQASLTRVRALLEKATSIGDVVALESELAAREADLDSLQRRLAAVRDQVALSTVTVELRRPAAPPAPAGPPAGFGSGLGAGWDGLKAVGTAVAVVAGFLLPFLPLLALAAAAVVAVRRRARRARVTPGAAAPVDRTPTAVVPEAPEQVAVGTRGGPGPEGV